MGAPLSAPVRHEVWELAEVATSRGLAIYVGAGLSAAPPSRYPVGKGLVQQLEEFARSLGLDVRSADGELKTLETLGDEAAVNGVIGALKIHISELDVFSGRANESHRITAILLREGIAWILSANWDEGIERGGVAEGISIPVVRTDEDRLRMAVQNALLKLHGCLTRPESLQVTTAEIASIAGWAQSEAERALSVGTVVFVGIGTVAEYVSARVDQVLDIAGNEVTVWVVARSITEAWAGLLRNRPGSRAIEDDGDDFLDQLLRAVLIHVLDQTEGQARRMVEDGSVPEALLEGVRRLRSGIEHVHATWLWHWAGGGAVGIPVGASVVTSQNGIRALLALGQIIDSTAVDIRGGGSSLTIAIPNAYLEVVIADGATAQSVVDSERARIQERRTNGVYADLARPIVHVVSGHMGRLPDPDVIENLIGAGESDDLIDGPGYPQNRWVSAQGAVEGTDTRWM